MDIAGAAIATVFAQFVSVVCSVMEEHLEAEDALDWIKKRFNVDLSSYNNMSEVILSTDGWKAILHFTAGCAVSMELRFINQKQKKFQEKSFMKMIFR